MLSVIHVYTRECLTLEVSSGFGNWQVTRKLEKSVAKRGATEAIRYDNRPEFTSPHFLACAQEHKIDLVHIGARTTGAECVNSFHGKLRDECLNANWFGTLFEASVNTAARKER